MEFINFILFWAFVFKLSTAIRLVLTEGRSGDLHCNSGYQLNIQFAKYEGRPMYCPTHEVTDVVQKQCHGKQICTVYAKDKHYTDSCRFASEVLTIRYSCEVSVTTLPTISHVSTYASTRDDAIVTEESTTNQTEVLVNPRESLTVTVTSSTNGTITLASLIACCIFGLLLVGLITVVIYRRFRQSKLSENENIHIQMNPLPNPFSNLQSNIYNVPNDNNVVPASNGNRETLASGSFQNNSYGLEIMNRQTVLNSVINTPEEITTEKFIDENEYSIVQRDSELAMTSDLPPSYDVANGGRLNFTKNQSFDRYSHANYIGDDYDRTTNPVKLQWSGNLNDEYSTSTTLLLESVDCDNYNRPAENVYENGQLKLQVDQLSKENVEMQSGCKPKSVSEKLKIDTDETNHRSKKNKYVNINLNKESNEKATYQNLDTTEWNNNQSQGYMPMNFDSTEWNNNQSQGYMSMNFDSTEWNNNQSQGYMPMNFGQKQSGFPENDNVYVPVMSPTTTVSTSDVFEDTYQC